MGFGMGMRSSSVVVVVAVVTTVMFHTWAVKENESQGNGEYLLEAHGQVAANRSFELDLNVQICFERQLQAVGVSYSTAAELLLLVVRDIFRLPGVASTQRNLAAHGAGVCDGSVHTGAVRTDTLEWSLAVEFHAGVGLFNALERRSVHVLSVAHGLFDTLAPVTSRGAA